MQERICSKCGVGKPETERFFRRRGTKDRGGLRPDCRACSDARDKAYYQANREHWVTYRRANAERISKWYKEYKRRYYRTPSGRAVIKRANRKWQTSPDGRLAMALAEQRRRARLVGLESTFTAADWKLSLRWFGRTCAYCGRSDVVLNQEHVIPVEAGGPYSPGNIVPACGSCNSSKSTKPIADWFSTHGSFSEERMQMIFEYLALSSVELALS